MAKKPKNTETSGEKIIPKEVFASLIRLSKATKEKTQSAAGELGQKIAHHVEFSHLHSKAFRMVAGLCGMKDELKRKEAIRMLKLYLDLADECGFFGSEHVGDIAEQAMEAAKRAAEEAQDQEAAHVAENAAKITKGIAQLEEEDEADPGDPEPASEAKEEDLDIPAFLDRRSAKAKGAKTGDALAGLTEPATVQ